MAIGGYSFAHCELHQDSNGYLQVHVGTAFSLSGRPAAPAAGVDRRCRLGSQRRRVGARAGWRVLRPAISARGGFGAAFATLRRELAWFDAPPALLRAAAAAERDEVVHAQLTAGLARRHGVAVALPDVAPTPARSLAEMTDENVVEGCVREAYGALVATYKPATLMIPSCVR